GLVRRFVRDEEVGGSNLATPTVFVQVEGSYSPFRSKPSSAPVRSRFEPLGAHASSRAIEMRSATSLLPSGVECQRPNCPGSRGRSLAARAVCLHFSHPTAPRAHQSPGVISRLFGLLSRWPQMTLRSR